MSTMNCKVLLLCVACFFSSIWNVYATVGDVTSSDLSQQEISDSRQEGLNGRVRSVHAESVRVTRKANQLVESSPVLLESSTYDLNGRRVNTAYFPNPNSLEPTGREVYTYDNKGNITEMVLLDKDGTTLSKEKYEYEFDDMGNWTKMTRFVVVIEGGLLKYEVAEIIRRNIAYFYEPKLIKDDLAQAGSPKPKAQEIAQSTPPKISQQQNVSPQPMPVAVFKQEEVNTIDQSAFVSNPPPPSTKKVEDKPSNENGSEVIASINPNLKTAPNTPSPTVNNTPPYRFINRADEILNAKALELPKPPFPAIAKTLRLKGKVKVEIIIDANGKVISARAVDGPKIFHAPATEAALRAKFSPQKSGGQGVKTTGVIYYDFAP
jgi:TonB family protein